MGSEIQSLLSYNKVCLVTTKFDKVDLLFVIFTKYPGVCSCVRSSY